MNTGISLAKAKNPDYASKIPDVNFQPVFSSIVVWRIPEAEKTVGGLYIPETSQSPRDRGILLAAGLKALDELASHGIEIGDVVIFAKYAGSDMTVKEKEGASPDQILVLKSGDILASEGLAKRMSTGKLYVGCIEGEHYLTEGKPGEFRTKRFDPGKAGK